MGWHWMFGEVCDKKYFLIFPFFSQNEGHKKQNGEKKQLYRYITNTNHEKQNKKKASHTLALGQIARKTKQMFEESFCSLLSILSIACLCSGPSTPTLLNHIYGLFVNQCFSWMYCEVTIFIHCSINGFFISFLFFTLY